MMTPEETLALALSTHPGFTKTAAARTREVYDEYQKLSVDEIEGILRAHQRREDPRFIEKISHVDAWARELARADYEKQAAPIGMLAKGLGKGVNAITGASGGMRTAVGAGVGAAGGLAQNAMSSDPNKGSALGSMAVGAGLGAGAGFASKAAVTSLGGMRNGVGNAIRRTAAQQMPKAKNLAEGASTNVASRKALVEMQQKARRNTQGLNLQKVAPKPAAPVAAAPQPAVAPHQPAAIPLSQQKMQPQVQVMNPASVQARIQAARGAA